jgi:hypothetical protein
MPVANAREEMVGAAGFEPTTTSPPDWCNPRSLRSVNGGEVVRTLILRPSRPPTSALTAVRTAVTGPGRPEQAGRMRRDRESGTGAVQLGWKPGWQRVQTVLPNPVPVSDTLVIWMLPAESGPILSFIVP